MKLGPYKAARPPTAKEVVNVEPKQRNSRAEVAMRRAIEHSHWGVALRHVFQPSDGRSYSQYIGIEDLRANVAQRSSNFIQQRCKQVAAANEEAVVAGLKEVFCMTAAMLFYEYYMSSPAFKDRAALPADLDRFAVQVKRLANRARPPSCRHVDKAMWDNVVMELAYRMCLWELFEQCGDGLQTERQNVPLWQHELECMHKRYIAELYPASENPKEDFCQHFTHALNDSADLPKRDLTERIEAFVSGFLVVSRPQAGKRVAIVSEQYRTREYLTKFARGDRTGIPLAWPTVKGFALLLADLANLKRVSTALRTRCEHGWVHLMLSKVLFLRGVGSWEPDGKRTLEQAVNEVGDAVRMLGAVRLRTEVLLNAAEGGEPSRSPIGSHLADDVAFAFDAWSSISASFNERDKEIIALLRGVLVNSMRNFESDFPTIEESRRRSWLWRLVFSDPRLWSQVARPLLEPNSCDYKLIYVERVQP